MLDAADIIRIHQLLGRYGHLIDARDWHAFGALFIDDATIDYRGTTADIQRAGREAIVDWFRAGAHPSAHHVTNIVVDEQPSPDGSVRVHSKFIAPFTRDEHEPKRLYGGDYHDVVVLTDNGWRFAAKQCLPSWNLAIVVDADAPTHRRTY